jgi:hypothetical protein
LALVVLERLQATQVHWLVVLTEVIPYLVLLQLQVGVEVVVLIPRIMQAVVVLAAEWACFVLVLVELEILHQLLQAKVITVELTHRLQRRLVLV